MFLIFYNFPLIFANNVENTGNFSIIIDHITVVIRENNYPKPRTLYTGIKKTHPILALESKTLTIENKKSKNVRRTYNNLFSSKKLLAIA